MNEKLDQFKTVANPRVTIVTATYNRSHILRYAIESVRRNTVTDWELLVIGDACTDDSADVVASYKDPRIQFINLENNVGEQSGPNNEGLKRAKGKYVAFLNHDDIWLEDHLDLGIRTLERSGAELAIALPLVVRPDGREYILGPVSGASFYREDWFPASTWIFKRSLVDDVGYWRFYRDCWDVPSQNWLRRVWNRGNSIVSTNCLSLVVIGSASRTNSYVSKDQTLHDQYSKAVTNPGEFRNLSLPGSAFTITKTKRKIGSAGRAIVYRLAGIIGLSPRVLMIFIRHRRKGKQIDKAREIRGLPFLKRK